MIIAARDEVDIDKVISSFPTLSDTTVANMLHINEHAQLLPNPVDIESEINKMNSFDYHYEDFNSYLVAQQINDYYTSYSFPDASCIFDPNFNIAMPSAQPTPPPQPSTTAPSTTATPEPSIPPLGNLTNKMDQIRQTGKVRRAKASTPQFDHEEQNVFVMKVKRARIRLGFTQADVGISLGALYDRNFSQTTVCRFESQQLSPNNMKRLVPILRRWCNDIDNDAERVQRLTNAAVESRKRTKKCTIDGETKRILVRHYATNPSPTHDQLTVMARSFDLDKTALAAWFRNYNNSLDV